MPPSNPVREPRRGVIVMHPFGSFKEAEFLEDPVLIDRLIADGQSWRFTDAVMLPLDR